MKKIYELIQHAESKYGINKFVQTLQKVISIQENLPIELEQNKFKNTNHSNVKRNIDKVKCRFLCHSYQSFIHTLCSVDCLASIDEVFCRKLFIFHSAHIVTENAFCQITYLVTQTSKVKTQNLLFYSLLSMRRIDKVLCSVNGIHQLD